MKTDECLRSPPTPLRSALPCFLTFSASYLYYFQIHLRHLLAPFPFWRPLIPLSVALLRCVSFTLARMKNSRRILAHSYLEIVLAMHIYILPQCSTTAASVLNSAGMDAQFERSCCAISRGILNIVRGQANGHTSTTSNERS